ncbi:MAG: hypothetical protein WCJ41_21035 [Aestuariivirga sp.]|jgi:hypothetical protein|uniref:hypothetical protein n=1 Tax=Aestuariivirga sp. TaxID=2650926 RepID=UPI003016BA38
MTTNTTDTAQQDADYAQFQRLGYEIAMHVTDAHADATNSVTTMALAKALSIVIALTTRPGFEIEAAQRLAAGLVPLVEESLMQAAADEMRH